MPVTGVNAIIDISHYQSVSSWDSVKNDGIVAVIHKATEGRTYHDNKYLIRRDAAKAAGLLWGSYHFSSSSDPVLQVNNYLDYAKPADDELICLDYEPSSSGNNMTYDQMVDFVELLHQELGRYPVIYGGSFLREATKNVPQSILSNCPLWYARYAWNPIGVPKLWKSWTLWQYIDGNVGPPPHDVQGIGSCDRDTFNGTNEQFLSAWPLITTTAPLVAHASN